MRDPLRLIQNWYGASNASYPSLWRIARFVISGGTATAANLTVLFVLTHYLSLWYILSSVIAFCTAFSISFLLQKLWTFQDKSREGAHIQMVLFLGIVLFGLGVNTALIYTFVEFMGVHYLVAQLMSGVLIAIGNFFSYKHIVFTGTRS